jgi:hypothetical protein
MNHEIDRRGPQCNADAHEYCPEQVLDSLFHFLIPIRI